MNPESPGPGVVGALAKALRQLNERIEVKSIDQLWVFPPLIRGRRESGLITVSTFGVGSDQGTRVLHTMSYTAEQTGAGITFEATLLAEGIAPPDRFPRVMDGVVQRGGGEGLQTPRQVEIGGSLEVYDELLSEFESPGEELGPAKAQSSESSE